MSWVQDSFGLIGTTLDGKFRVERAVAEGGFAIVYAGQHITLRRPVAIKVLKRPTHLTDPQYETFMEGFAAEARTSAKITHPNIVQVLDFGISPMPSGARAPWMVLEWLDGRTLREQMLERRGQGGYPLGEALGLARPVLEALAYAHDEGVAHRDIKPANIMLVPTRRGNVMKLLDFGIAKLMEQDDDVGHSDEHTTASFQAFSLNYATPEQLGGTRTGPWTDVHAMALVLTELLTGRQALVGSDRTEIMGRILSPQRPTPAYFGVDAGPIEPVLQRAMAVRPVDRFANAGEFLLALDAALTNCPTEVRVAAAGIRATGQYSAVPTGGFAAGAYGGQTGAQFAPPQSIAAGAQSPSTLTALTTSHHGATQALPPKSSGRGALLVGAALLVAGFTAGGALLRMRMTRDAAAQAAALQAASASANALSAQAVASAQRLAQEAAASALAAQAVAASAAASPSAVQSAALEPSAAVVVAPSAAVEPSAPAGALDPAAPSAEPAPSVAVAVAAAVEPPARARTSRPARARAPRASARPSQSGDPEVD